MEAGDTPAVPGQRWPDVPAPPVGEWTPSLSVCVVLPARDCQPELARTLASLLQQTYPPRLLEVLVVDDASTPALRLPRRLPDRFRIIHRQEQAAHGSGSARHAGAEATDAEIILFLDSDMIVDRRHVEAHARWHHLIGHAVVLGRKSFVDVEGLSPRQVGLSARRDRLPQLFARRLLGTHQWQEDFIAARDRLTQDTDDAFLAVVGPTVSVRRDFYRHSGGFASFGLRGIVDTEFGYRAHTRGGLLVPDDDAVAYHQGPRSFANRSGEIKLLRTGLAANHLPIPLFRPSNTGRQWAVPTVGVVVEAGAALPQLVQITVDSVLASSLTDLAVTVVPGEADTPWLRDYYAHEARVSFTTARPPSAYPSPVTAVIPAGRVVDSSCLERATDLLREEHVGLVRSDRAGADGAVEVWRTRALSRGALVTPDGAGRADIERRAVELFGERLVAADVLGVREARYGVTKQGMLVAR